MADYTRHERLTLCLQFLALDRVEPNNGWDKCATIVQRGYTPYYHRFEQMISDEISSEGCKFVEDVLALHEALQDKLGATSGDSLFPGFDGNNETEYLAYARFLRDDGRWSGVVSSAHDLNSHWPVVSTYRRMLAAWTSAGAPRELTDQVANSVIEAKTHPDNR